MQFSFTTTNGMATMYNFLPASCPIGHVVVTKQKVLLHFHPSRVREDMVLPAEPEDLEMLELIIQRAREFQNLLKEGDLKSGQKGNLPLHLEGPDEEAKLPAVSDSPERMPDAPDSERVVGNKGEQPETGEGTGESVAVDIKAQIEEGDNPSGGN